jgi:hypothetical protein
VGDILGPAILVVLLVVVLPVVFLLAGGIGAVILGSALHRTVEADHADSELTPLTT